MIPAYTLEAVRAITGEHPHTITRLPGATSSILYRLTFARHSLVLRELLPSRWLESPQALSHREHALLSALPTGLRGPAPVAVLPGNGVLMSHVGGRVMLPVRPTPKWLDRLAAQLARVHDAQISVPYEFESWNDQRGKQPPGDWPDVALWAAAQAVLASGPEQGDNRSPEGEVTFIHRDYHPVNVLWEGESISGLVDWINACMGPRGIDVAHCRLNLALMYGQAAADGFLDAYCRQVPGYRHAPYWDIEDAFSALPYDELYPPWKDLGLDHLTLDTARNRLVAFIAAAVRRTRQTL